MTVSVHLLDSVHGSPAVGVGVTVERGAGAGWQAVSSGRTDATGRCLVADSGAPDARGPRRVSVATDEYFVALGLVPYYRGVIVSLPRTEAAGVEIRLALSPFAYTLSFCRVPEWSSPDAGDAAARR